jgi:hypothetical protein
MFSKVAIEKYFIAEKHAGLFLLIVGIIALVVACVVLFSWKTSFAKGVATSLLVAGLLQVFAGYIGFSRSDERRIDNVYAFDMNPSKLKLVELPRMQSVNRNLVIYKWISILLFLTGAGLVVFFKANTAKSFLFGLGLAFAVEAAIFAGYSSFLGQKATAYVEQLNNFFQRPS